MDELEHIREFLGDYVGPTSVEVNHLFSSYEGWAEARPRLSKVVLVKRLVSLGAYKRRSNGKTVVDFTGVE